MKILIGCDVDPVLPAMLDRRPAEDVWECLKQVDTMLERMGEEMPPVTWLIRADQSVEFATGSLASGYSEHATLWDKVQERGHELGWHMHTMSFAPSRQQFVFDPVPGWLAKGHDSLAQLFPVNATRTDWDYGSNELLSALDRLGIAVDFSALPGNLLWFSAGTVQPASHRSRCDSSCYDCLRQYRNMNYHGLLDWPLGLAALRIFASVAARCGIDGRFALPEIEAWPEWTSSLRDSFALSFGGRSRDFARLPGCIIGRKQVIFVHPLWDCNSPGELLAEAVADADQNGEIRFLDTFNVVRRPSFAYQSLS